MKKPIKGEEMSITDTGRLNWLETQFGCGLVNDDNGHWAIAYDGFQNVVTGGPKYVETSFIVEAKGWKRTIGAAIDAQIKGARIR